MPRQYDEKRDYIRVDVDCAIMFRVRESDAEEYGKVANLSGRGMMFIASRELPKESIIEIRIQPDTGITPPLHAHVRVVRIAKQRRGDGFEIGAVIQDVIDNDDDEEE